MVNGGMVEVKGGGALNPKFFHLPEERQDLIRNSAMLEFGDNTFSPHDKPEQPRMPPDQIHLHLVPHLQRPEEICLPEVVAKKSRICIGFFRSFCKNILFAPQKKSRIRG